MSGQDRAEAAAPGWGARYQAERTPWERPTLNPAFLTWRSSGVLAPCRILVSGAGRSGEPIALARDGFDVTVVDLSPAAIAVQRVRLDTAGLAATVHEADLLTWKPSKRFDAAYDQACLCALPPSSWAAYAARLHDWLRPGGALFILFKQTGQPGGPPFDCPSASMRDLFSAGWSWPDAAAEMTDRNELPMMLTRL